MSLLLNATGPLLNATGPMATGLIVYLQRVVAVTMRAEVLLPHPQRVGAGCGLQRWEGRMVRIVALDALAPRLLALVGIPIAVGAAMRSMLPITEDGTMTLGAQQLRLVPRNFTPHVVNEDVAVCWVVAIEATGIEPVL